MHECLTKKKIGALFLNYELYILVIYVLFITIAIVIFGKLVISGFLGDYYTYDSYTYLNASTHPFDRTIIQIPYSYRILTPLFVYLLPIDHHAGFKVINILGFMLTGFLFYYYLKEIRFNPVICLTGVLILLLSPIMVYTLYNIYLVDDLEYFLLLMSFYAILKQDNRLFIASASLGVLNKDAALLAIPLYFLYHFDNKKRLHTIKSTISISMLPLTIFLLIKYYFGGSAGYFSLNLENIIAFHLRDGTPIFWQIYTAFGILTIIFIYNMLSKKIGNRYLQRSLYLIPLICLLYLICDIPRATFLAFPIIIPASLYIFMNSPPIKCIALLLIAYLMAIILVISNIIKTNFSQIDLIVSAFDITILSLLLAESVFFNNHLDSNSKLEESKIFYKNK